MARKTFVLDTNVLLHDPESIYAFRDSDVIIPLAVLEELDALKHKTNEQGKNARYVVRAIDTLKRSNRTECNKKMQMDNKATLSIYIEKSNVERQGFPLPLDRANNKILFVAFQLAKENGPVVLVSKDFVMRVKAESIGLQARDYENLKFSFENLYRGYTEIEVPKKDIDQFYKDGFLKFSDREFKPNEYCVLKSVERSSAVCKYNAKTQSLEGLLPLKKDLWGVHPLNVEQKCALDLLLRDDIKLIALVGQAGTGKTLLALATAMHKVFDENTYSRILVSRPIVPLGKDIGYLPGSKEEKLVHWMQPIYDNLEYLCQSNSDPEIAAETQKWILESKKIEMEAVTYIRGRSLPKMFIIIDEAQNLTPHEVKTVISRAGQGTKVILTGDPTQIDNPYLDKDSNALTYVIGKFQHHPIFGSMLLERTERSELAAHAAELL